MKSQEKNQSYYFAKCPQYRQRSRSKHKTRKTNNKASSYTSTIIESKDQYLVKPRLGQGRSVIKKKMLRFPMPQPFDKMEQPKLLPRKKPIHTNNRKTNFAILLKCFAT